MFLAFDCAWSLGLVVKTVRVNYMKIIEEILIAYKIKKDKRN